MERGKPTPSVKPLATEDWSVTPVCTAITLQTANNALTLKVNSIVNSLLADGRKLLDVWADLHFFYVHYYLRNGASDSSSRFAEGAQSSTPSRSDLATPKKHIGLARIDEIKKQARDTSQCAEPGLSALLKLIFRKNPILWEEQSLYILTYITLTHVLPSLTSLAPMAYAV